MENEKLENKQNKINFNQDGSCFIVATQKGFKIFNLHPIKECIDRGKITPTKKRNRRRNLNNRNIKQFKHNRLRRIRLKP